MSCLHRVGEFFVVIGAIQSGALRFHFIAGRGGDMDVEVEHLGRLQPGVAHIVGVADPGQGLASNAAALFDVSVDIGEDLARMIFVGEAVDHRHPRVTRETFNNFLIEGADHHHVRHARDDLRRVFHRLAAPELRVAGVEINRGAAKLLHAGFERQAGASRRFFKNHDQGAVGEWPVAPVGLEFVFDPARAREHVVQLVAA